MAGPYDITDAPTGYGAATGFSALQQELLRRAQLQAIAEAAVRQQAQQQFENTRQLKNDQQNAELHAANIAQAKANLASMDDQRKAAIAVSNEATQQKQQAELTNTVAPGPVTPDIAQEFRSAGLGRLILSQPKTGLDTGDATPLPGTTVPVGDAAPVSAPVMLGPSKVPTLSTQDVNTGTQAQQLTKRQEDVRRKLLSGETKIDRSDSLAMETLWKDMGGTGALPAGVVVPKAAPKTPAETKAAHDLKMEEMESQVAQGYKPTADEAADLKVWRSRNPTQADKNDAAHVNIQLHTDAAAGAASTHFTEQAKSRLQAGITKQNDMVSTDLRRNDKALMALSKPGWVSDASAIPEYLQIMAGGMGSGLRMTTAEINKVQHAQSYFAQLQAKMGRLPFAEFFGAQPKTIQDDMRAHMVDLLQTVREASKRTTQLHVAALRALKSAKSSDDVLTIQANYLEKMSETPDQIDADVKAGKWTTGFTDEPADTATAVTPGPSKYKVTVK